MKELNDDHTERKQAKLDADKLYKRAVKERKEGNMEEAEKYYRKCLAVNPDHQAANCNYAIVLLSLKNYSAALEYAKKAVALDPERALFQFNLGNIFRILNDNQNCRIHFEKCITLDPNYFKAHANLAIINRVEGKYDEAFKNLKRYFQLCPENTQKFLLWRTRYFQHFKDCDIFELYEQKLTASFDQEIYDYFNCFLAIQFPERWAEICPLLSLPFDQILEDVDELFLNWSKLTGAHKALAKSNTAWLKEMEKISSERIVFLQSICTIFSEEMTKIIHAYLYFF